MERRSAYTVGDLARLSGVTVRTLHHYDRSGCSCPSEPVGRRLSRVLARGRRAARPVLAYRACGLELAEIAALLVGDRRGPVRAPAPAAGPAGRSGSADLDRAAAGAGDEHGRRATMGINLDPDEMLEVFGEHDPTPVRRRGARSAGGAPTPTASRIGAPPPYTKEDWLRLRSGVRRRSRRSWPPACAGEPADGERARGGRRAHRAHIDTWFYPCSHDMQVGPGGHVRRRSRDSARTTTTAHAGPGGLRPRRDRGERAGPHRLGSTA